MNSQPPLGDLGHHIPGWIEQRMQPKHLGETRDISGQFQCASDPFSGYSGDTGELFCADGRDQVGVIGGPRPHRDTERQVQQMHLKADLVGDTNQGRVGVRGEIKVG